MNKNNKPILVHKIYVTGSTGFIGHHLVPVLLRNGYEVIVIVRDILKAQKFEWYKDVSAIVHDYHLEEFNFDVSPNSGLIHLAWPGLPNYSSAFHFEKNLMLDYKFIKEFVTRGIQKVLVTGTCFEYGARSGPISSQDRTCPDNPYAVAKDTLRRFLQLLANDHSFSLVWARLFYMFGEGQNKNSILAQLNTAIERGDSVFNMSQGEQLRDYLSVSEVVEQIFELYSNKESGVFNVCSGQPISVRRLVEEHLSKLGIEMKLNLGFYSYPKHEPMAFWGKRDVF